MSAVSYGERIRRVAFAGAGEIDEAVQAAKAAFPGWAATPPLTRARVMFKFLELLHRDHDALARVISEPRPDSKDNKSWVVDVTFVRRLAQPVTLREIKESHKFDDWSLVRQSRLSTMRVPDNVVAWLKEKKVL